jgi:predicted permease
VPMTILDLKYAVRLLVKRPWFTLLTVLVLSGGLGISLYTFAALNTMIYRDLPLPDGGSIVRVGVGDWVDFEPLDAFELSQLRAETETLSELGVYRTSRALVGEPGSIQNVRSVESDWSIFEFSRTPPLFGRGFVSDDSSATGEPVAVLSHKTWQSEFSGDADVVGDVVRINGRLTRIVGVMPEGYAFPVNAEIWLPLGTQNLNPAGYTGTLLDAYARLRPGVSAEAAEAELTALLQGVRQEHPAADDQGLDSVSVMSFQEESWGLFGTLLFGVLNMLSLSILLLAAVNVGNLLLARTNERIKEVGVRIALGAPRFRLIVQTTLENVILCTIGGLLAIFLAGPALQATNGFMSALLGGDLPFWWTWRLDREVVAVAGLFLLLTVLVVSILPALCVSRVDPNSLLRDGTRAGAGLSTGRISRGLVTVEVALISAVMLVGSAVAVIANRAATFDFGMNTDNLLRMSIALPTESYQSPEEQLSFYQRLLAELRATDGIDAAAVMQESGGARFAAAGREYAGPDDYPGGWLVVLSETPSPVGPTLIEGRAFDSRDSTTGQKTAIVSETLARTHWPNESPLGQRIETVGEVDAEQRVVVGVVSDVRFDPLGMTPMGVSAIYVPLPQLTLPGTNIAVRHFGDEGRARSAIYEALRRVDPAVAPGDVRSYESGLEQMTLFARTMTKLFAGCGVFAVLLAITGIYGMSSNAVVLRSHEIGLRRALGASNGNVIAIFVAQGVRQLSIGLALSAMLCTLVLFAISRGFSVGAWTLALIATTVVLVVSASVLLSIYLSVRGVIRLEPSAALR